MSINLVSIPYFSLEKSKAILGVVLTLIVWVVFEVKEMKPPGSSLAVIVTVALL